MGSNQTSPHRRFHVVALLFYELTDIYNLADFVVPISRQHLPSQPQLDGASFKFLALWIVIRIPLQADVRGDNRAFPIGLRRINLRGIG